MAEELTAEKLKEKGNTRGGLSKVNKQRTRQIWIDPADLEILIIGLSRVCEALTMEPYSYTIDGIIGTGDNKSRGEAAVDFLQKYYDITGGILELIAGASGIIAKGLANNDINSVLKD